jgi:hypothetical protein
LKLAWIENAAQCGVSKIMPYIDQESKSHSPGSEAGREVFKVFMIFLGTSSLYSFEVGGFI